MKLTDKEFDGLLEVLCLVEADAEGAPQYPEGHHVWSGIALINRLYVAELRRRKRLKKKPAAGSSSEAR